MTIVNNSYYLLPLLLVFLGLILLVIIIRGHIKSTIHRLFALYLLMIALWGLFIFAMRYSPDIDHALRWDRFPLSLAPLMSVVLYHFSEKYTNSRTRHWYIPLLYIVSFIFIILIFTGHILQDMQIRPYGYAPVFAPLFIPYALFMYTLSIWAMINFIKIWKYSYDVDKKNRAAYINMGLIIMIISGFGDLLPSFGLPLYPSVIIGMLIFCLLVTIAIVKHNLLDIRVAIRKSTAYFITSVLLATPFIGIFLIVTDVSTHIEIPLWASMLILLLIAVIWPQLWKVVQDRVDRWFFRGRYDTLKALEKFSRDTQSLSDSDQLASNVVQLITNALSTKSAYLLLLNKTEKLYETISYSAVKNTLSAISIKSSSLLVKWLDRYGIMLLVQDMEILPQLQAISDREKQALHDIEASLIIPLKLSGRPLFGMLILGQKRSETPFTVEDKQLISTICNQMAMKLNNVQLYIDILNSRESFQSWLNIMPDCIIVVSPDETIEYMNDAAKEHFGNRTVEPYCNISNDSLDIIDEVETTFISGQNKTIHNVHLRIAGRLYDIRQTSLMRIDGVVSNIKVLRDITEHKHNEEELKLRALLLDNATDAIFLYDDNGHFYYVNEAACRVFGYSKEELLQIRYEDLIVSGIPSVQTQRIKTTRKDYLSIETHLKHKNGTIIPVEIHSGAIISNHAKYYLAVVRDITKRIEREQELRQSQEKLMQIFQHVSDGISVTDMNGVFTEVNEKTLQLHGYKSESELMGTDARQNIAPYDRERTYNFIQQVIQKGTGTIEVDMLRLDGTSFKAEMSTSILSNAANEPTGVINIVRDITERKKAEEEKKLLERKAQLASQLASVGEMAAGIAHEINNPLTSVIGYAQLLMKQNIPEDLKEEISIIHEGAQRVSGIVNRMLTFARQRKPRREQIDINDIIEATLDLRQYSLKNNNIEIIRQLDPDLPMTVADTGQLQQVFLNIIVNAEIEMKLAHEKGSLTISTSTQNDTISISFTDDGPGIAEEHLSRVFDPFFTTREVGQGTGLGLSVCHGIISEHGGSISVKNEKNGGATFIIELPVISGAGKIEDEPIGIRTSRNITKARILIVDDEDTIRHYLHRLLTGEGYTVETAENAAEALETIKHKRFNLILLDVKMPVMSGTDLYIQLQDIAKSLAKRVLFITGDVMGEDTYKFFTETKTPYITKPFNDTTLIEKIKSMLD